jgi:hypothetical protein
VTTQGSNYGKAHDQRFSGYHRQPRSDKLDKRQKQICKSDPAYAAALQKRVADPNRWAAFVAGQSWYGSDNFCKRCESNKRRVYNRECWTCRTNSRAENWQRILVGQPPIATRSRDGHLAILDEKRREKRGEFEEHSVGEWRGRRFPTGRLAVWCPSAAIQGAATDGAPLPPLPASPYLADAPFGTLSQVLEFNCPDLNKADPRFLHGLADRNPDFLSLLRWASWV